ncbi:MULTISPECIES: hypothetical protein [Fusobacterium]|nr:MULTISPECIES: hypothetical protein [Fusobacterium]WCB33701.1 hypothetical protein PGW91_04150 [Fusobacterium nucleatum]
MTTYDELYKEMVLKDKSNLNAKEVLNFHKQLLPI